MSFTARAVLTGNMSVQDGRVMWQGKWKMEPPDEETKEAKFKYGGPKDVVADTKLTAKLLCGKYNG